MGIEINPYAAELARVMIWIGEIQWMLNHGFAYLRDPILQPLDTIREQDALLDLSDPANPREPDWPEAEVIIGNPPFLGGKLLRSGPRRRVRRTSSRSTTAACRARPTSSATGTRRRGR